MGSRGVKTLDRYTRSRDSRARVTSHLARNVTVRVSHYAHHARDLKGILSSRNLKKSLLSFLDFINTLVIVKFVKLAEL